LVGGLSSAAGCVTDTAFPPTVSVAERVDDDEFGATLNVTVPLPEPLAPLTMVSQLALLDEVQLHPEVVVSVTLAVSPAAAIV
jgi:hypothetical protein